MDGFSARAEGRLDGLGGKLDRAEGTLSVLGNRLETASARTEALTEEAMGALGGEVEAASARTEEALGALGGKVDAASSRTEGQLNEVAAKVADAGNKLDRTDAKLESVRTQAAQAEKKVTRKLDTLIRVLCANFVGVTALFILHCHHSQSAVQPARGATASIGVGQGAAEVRATAPCFDDPTPCNDIIDADASGELGKKEPGENWIPSEPWKWQKPPPCNEGLREKAINGGCWQLVGGSPPCGPQLWRKGDSCYRPISAKPKRPVGDEPRQVTPEHQMQ
jgi:hypothetical protein